MLGAVALVVLGAAGPWGSLGIDATGSLTSYGLVDATSKAASGTAAFSAFLHHRLIEDGGPYSLQPYLQRAGSVGGTFSASAFSTDVAGFPGAYAGNALGGSLHLDAYPGGAFTLWIYGAFARSETHGDSRGPTTYLLPRAEIAPGLRFGDTRVSLGYRYAPTIIEGVYDGGGFGEPFLRIEHVIDHKIFVSGLVQLILSGVRGTLQIIGHPLRALGIGASFEYAEGAIDYDTHTVYRRLQPGLGVTWWFGGRSWVSLSYEFTHTLQVHDSTNASDTHRLSLGLGLRLG